MIALLAKAEYPKAPLELQMQVGWLALLFATLMLIWAWTRSEPLRRAIFAREDPRLFAVFRIGLGLITFQNFWNLNMHWRMLWTDEGMFTGLEVRKRLGRAALTGWSELDGFIDHWALVKYFWGKHSLLFLHSDPAFVQGYLAVLYILLILFIFGVRARVTAVVLWLMINGLYNRNAVYIEGHDTVFRCAWFLVMFARIDAGWSVDNWIRRKREEHLAKALTGADSPGAIPYDWRHLLDRAGHVAWAGLCAGTFCTLVEFPLDSTIAAVSVALVVALAMGWFERMKRQGAQAAGELEVLPVRRFWLIPAWPRYLYVAQLICIYSATGLYKTGSVWKAGDALYYALNMDHFYRFEGPTQWVSVYLGMNLFKLMSLVTLYWEKAFLLVAIGLILRWRHLHRDEPWYQASQTWWRKLVGGGALIGAYAVVYRTMVLAYPWCLALQKDKSPQPAAPGLANLHLWFAVIVPSLIVAWHLLGRWPIPIGKLLASKPIVKLTRGGSERFAEATIDQEVVRAWVLGRRIWLGIGLIFHGLLLTTMNIGMFPVIMMWFYVPYFEARPFLVTGRWFTKRLRRHKRTVWMAPAFLDAAFSEDHEVVESARDSLRRDPTGPWYLDPWKLVVGVRELVRRTSLKDALHAASAGGRDRGGQIPDGVVLALASVAVALVCLRGLEARTDVPVVGDSENNKKAQFVPGLRRAQNQAKRDQAEARKAKLDRLGDAAHWWVYLGLVIAAGSHFRRRPAEDRLADTDPGAATGAALEAEIDTEAGSSLEPGTDLESATKASATPALAEPQLVGSTILRTVILGFMIYHCGAVGTRFIPKYPLTAAWRTETQKVFGNWVRGTNQSQSWKMFAPNPPRSNTFMRTVVVDTDGQAYHVGNDHYHGRPHVFWYNDRERKMQRRMVGKSKWYLRYWSQYHCRTWAFHNDGHMPEEVRIFKLKTPIPKPEDVAKARKPSDPRKRKLKSTRVETQKCKPDAVRPYMKERRGWELTEADQELIERRVKDRERVAKSTRVTWENRTDFGGEKKSDQKAGDEKK